MKTGCHLGLFAKFWQPGKVKTRLAATIGTEAAARIFHLFLEHLVQALQTTGDRRTLVFSPPEAQNAFETLGAPAWETLPQSNGHLGQRMQAFFETTFDHAPPDGAPTNKTIIIGADCPTLSPTQIEEAFQQLDHFPVVIGPSTDGGYYLIGMRERCLPIFDEVAWSSSKVLEQTTRLLREQQFNYHLLPEMTDIDHEAELKQLLVQLEDCPTSSQAVLHQRMMRVLDADHSSTPLPKGKET